VTKEQACFKLGAVAMTTGDGLFSDMATPAQGCSYSENLGNKRFSNLCSWVPASKVPNPVVLLRKCVTAHPTLFVARGSVAATL
jgi:hypothetical protein